MWMSHHEILDSVKSASYGLMFANGLTLFTLSLVPFATAFAGETHWTVAVPVALYGMVMALACLAFVGHGLSAGNTRRTQPCSRFSGARR